MNAKIFVDSNVFLYTLDRNNPAKRERARNLLLSAGAEDRIFVSTQVMNEVFVAATRKLNVDPISAKEFVRGLCDFDLVPITPEIVQAAIDSTILQRLNYWDALMIAAAAAGRCSVLWTEDLQHGAVIRGVEIVNPFAS